MRFSALLVAHATLAACAPPAAATAEPCAPLFGAYRNSPPGNQRIPAGDWVRYEATHLIGENDLDVYDPVVRRWTAPAAGDYGFAFEHVFIGLGGQASSRLLVNGAFPVPMGTSPGGIEWRVHEASVALEAGDVVELQVRHTDPEPRSVSQTSRFTGSGLCADP